MVVVDRRTNIQRWLVCGGMGLALWGLLALADDLVTAGVLVRARMACLPACLPAVRVWSCLTGCTACVDAAQLAQRPCLQGEPRVPSLPTCPPVPNSHLLRCHSPPLSLFRPPQLDFFKYADFDLAPPEIQADLYEAAPEAWKRNA